MVATISSRMPFTRCCTALSVIRRFSARSTTRWLASRPVTVLLPLRV